MNDEAISAGPSRVPPMPRAVSPAAVRKRFGQVRIRPTPEGVRSFIEGDHEAASALEVISKACGGDCYLVGGAIRESALSSKRTGDLDIMVGNGDRRAFEALDALGVPFVLNRRQNRRYFWNRLQIDLFEPARFYGGFPTPEAALRFFDLRINALALHLGTNRLLDPLGGANHIERGSVGINWERWASPQMNADERWLLLVRLLRVMRGSPDLLVSSTEAERLGQIVQRLSKMPWGWVAERFPAGKSALLESTSILLETRARGLDCSVEPRGRTIRRSCNTRR